MAASLTIQSGIPEKVRGFIVDKSSGHPLDGVVVEATAQPIKDSDYTISLGLLVSDHAGYVSFDLRSINDMQSLEHLWICPIGDATAKLDLVAQFSTDTKDLTANNRPTRYRAQFILKTDGSLVCNCNGSIPLSSIQNPDIEDWELSPYSFSAKNDLLLGEAGCEVPVPSTEAEREYRFLQVVRMAAMPIPSKHATNRGYAARTDLGLTAASVGESGAVVSGLPITPVDPTVIQIPATMPITHGKVLEFRQTWIPKTHSLGAIIYSLALAPCESVNIAVIDWSREDVISRKDTIVSQEGLYHSQKRDRTIDEAIDAAITESQGGWSLMGGASATIPVKGVPVNIALGGGTSKSWGNRDLTADSGQELHDAIIQTTNVFRSLNSTVVVQATQAERNYLETRTITNHNHCHALTIQYYEVLRHFKVVTEFVESRRVVLVPFKLLTFDAELALRYRTILETILLDSKLVNCFDAIVRLNYCSTLYNPATIITGNSEQTTHPLGTTPLYRLYLVNTGDHFYTTSMTEKDGAKTNGYTDDGIAGYIFETQATGTTPLYRLYLANTGDHFYTTSITEKDGAKTNGYTDDGIAGYIFETASRGISTGSGGNSLAQSQPAIAWYEITLKSGKGGYSTTSGDIWVEILHDGSWKEIFHKDAVSNGGKELDKGTFSKQVDTTGHQDIAVDPAKISRVSVRWREDPAGIFGSADHWDFKGITVKYGLRNLSGTYKLIDTEGKTVPTNSKSADTGLKWFDDSGHGPDDWQEWTGDAIKSELKTKDEKQQGGKTSEEQPQPAVSREEDECCKQQLLAHLRANVGYYNRAIWLLQDPSERVIMLNAALANYPELLDSIDASPIAVSGNYVAFPYNIEPTTEEQEKETDLLKKNPLSRSIVSVPTRGVFAETHLSHCNACETRDVTRFWKWEESPCEQPPSIEGITPGPKGQTPTIQPTTLPSPVVQIMQPLAAPDPTGLAAALNLMGQPNIFRDMSGTKDVQQLLSGLAKAQQKPEERHDNVQVAKEVAKAANDLGLNHQQTTDLVQGIIRDSDSAVGHTPSGEAVYPAGGAKADGIGGVVAKKTIEIALDTVEGTVTKAIDGPTLSMEGVVNGSALLKDYPDLSRYVSSASDKHMTTVEFLDVGGTRIFDGFSGSLTITWTDCRINEAALKSLDMKRARILQNVICKQGINVDAQGHATGKAISKVTVEVHSVFEQPSATVEYTMDQSHYVTVYPTTVEAKIRVILKVQQSPLGGGGERLSTLRIPLDHDAKYTVQEYKTGEMQNVGDEWSVTETSAGYTDEIWHL